MGLFKKEVVLFQSISIVKCFKLLFFYEIIRLFSDV